MPNVVILKCQFRFLQTLLYLFTGLLSVVNASAQDGPGFERKVIAKGQMPALTSDNQHVIHMVYGSGDTIMYTFSSNEGKTFPPATRLSILPGLVAGATRGPQIAAFENGLAVMACNAEGNIFLFRREGHGGWEPAMKINDVDTVAKEGFITLTADRYHVFAAWLDLRGNGRNKIVGALSQDAGKSWSANSILYTSPQGSVCECCKLTAVMKGKRVYVMFRNWLAGNRDMYLIRSSDGGDHFGAAQKLGKQAWALQGCPMDGGGLTLNNQEMPETIWQRAGKIFVAGPGTTETEIGMGRSCTIASIDGKTAYAWVENGDVVCLLPGAIKRNLGKGKLPVLLAVNNSNLVCVWEYEKQIASVLLPL